MAKTQPEAPSKLTCPACGGERFQRHERGTFVFPTNVYPAAEDYQFVVDETAVQCLKCLKVMDVKELKP